MHNLCQKWQTYGIYYKNANLSQPHTISVIFNIEHFETIKTETVQLRNINYREIAEYIYHIRGLFCCIMLPPGNSVYNFPIFFCIRSGVPVLVVYHNILSSPVNLRCQKISNASCKANIVPRKWVFLSRFCTLCPWSLWPSVFFLLFIINSWKNGITQPELLTRFRADLAVDQ